jgi:Subtilase family/CARDB
MIVQVRNEKMKKFISNNKLIGSLKWGFFFGSLTIFTIFPFHFDVMDGIRSDLLLANHLLLEKDTLIKDPATGQMIPFSQLKSKNPKLSSSLNQLLSAYQSGGEPRMKAFAKEQIMELNKNLIQVVIEVTADPHEPLANELFENLKLRIVEVGGRFELDFNNLLQVLLPIHALEEVANWPEIKFIREPFRPHPIKDGPKTGDQSKAAVFEVISSIQSDEGHEIKIPMEYFKETTSENGSIYQGDLIENHSLKLFCDDTVCQKKIEIFSPDPSSYEQSPDEKQRDNENSLEEDRYLKGEKLVSAQTNSEVWFCLEYNCSSVTVTFAGHTHSSTLSCYRKIGFGNVAAGTYSYNASGCGSSWSGTITVSEGNYGIVLCPSTGNSACCPTGCGEGGSYLCERCGGSEKPNLTPSKPSGWSDKIVVSTNTGDHLDDSPLYDSDTLYIDLALANLGSAPTDQTYYSRLYLDNVLKLTVNTNPPHSPDIYATITDYPIGSLSAGTHTIKIAVDYDNRIAESNETDNEYTKTITVLYPSNQPVTSEGVSLIGADKWQNEGYTGQGVKIAIIDGGFENYNSLLGIELPDSVTTQFFGSDEDVNWTPHGTACAEIIHDMAPDAQFFLTQPRTEVELGNAVNWCISQGVQIISHSASYSIKSGPLDGTGPINDIVNQAVNHGITWVKSSGNYAKAHWSGDFYDPNGNGFLNFSDGDEANNFATAGGKSVSIGMIWDDPWGASANDYALYVFDLANTSSPVAYHDDIQDGDDDPREWINFTAESGVSYGFAIRKKSGISKKIHVTLSTQNPLQYQIPATSILIPADNPNVITVGAVAWNAPSEIEDYSSQGPTTDGRIKPDLVAPTKVSTSDYTYGAYPEGFPGTSASCPHVAGACALVKQVQPNWSPSQIKDFLESETSDLGTVGKDNIYGSGLVCLSDPPENGLENGYMVTSDLWIRAVINTEEKGPVDAIWQKGGEDTTSRGDRVIWGHFYASPSDVTWGSSNNPDLFVKIWFDVSGRIDVNYFHVSVPDIEVYSDYPYDSAADEHGTTTMSRRYIRQYYQGGQSYSDENYEDGNPPSGYLPVGNPSGYSTLNNLRIGSMINTVEKGSIDAIWRLGGQDTTARGDQVVWGHFYASPSDVTWGSSNNPDLFVKIWFDVSGRVDVNFFHVSVPDIEVYSDLPNDSTYDQKGTTIMDNRYIRHEFWR